MRPNSCLIVLLAFISASLIQTSGADTQDSECETVIQVRRNTLYQPSCGQKLIIKCPVFYCNKSPTISWIKLENNTHPVPVPVSGSSHITAEWEQINSTAGISKLIFNKILRSDSGLYCCGSEGSQSHVINVTVKGDGEFTTVKWQNDTTKDNPTTASWTTTDFVNPTAQDTFWPYIIHLVVAVVFFIIVTAFCVITNPGCRGESRKKTPGPSCPPSHHTSSTSHIYEN
ncbi:uncharacterized protein btla isoform X2 [Echeneis naucrates]|uniref:uncharacterized protein btla isoform X2 n=1 Tax=Echeneis naucrates TaxID=173247 RepID=UPI0011133E01|nr:uncharacterized protein LOC115056879 isoform X2 [Echeneis naucrates]